MPFDSNLDPFTIAIEQDRGHEEASTAGDDREQDKQPYIVAGEAGGDRDQLVGDRCHALHQDDQGAPLRIGGAECLDLAAKTVQVDQPVPDGVIEQCADGVAEDAAQDRRRCADRRIEPGPLRLRQRHRGEHDIGRHRKERAFGKSHGSQNPERMGLVGSGDTPVIDPSEHGAMNHPATDLSIAGLPRGIFSILAALARAAALERDNWSPCDPGRHHLGHLHRRFRHLLGYAQQMFAPFHFAPDVSRPHAR